jgi:hypothetical protein
MKSSQEHCDASAESIDSMEVRLIEAHERERFDRLLEEEHYLRSARLGGRHLRDVATVHGRWVALLTFSGAAPHLKVRARSWPKVFCAIFGAHGCGVEFRGSARSSLHPRLISEVPAGRLSALISSKTGVH